MQPRTPLGRVLKNEGRKQSWLADRAKADPSYISRIVNGLHPDDATAARVADALGRPVSDLWPTDAAEDVAA